MIRSSTACILALFTLPALALACTEPSGTGGTLDAPPAAVVDAAAVPTEAEVPVEDAAVLATGDAAAQDPDQDPDQDPAGEGDAEAAEMAAGEQDAAEDAPNPGDDAAALEPRRVLIVGSSLAATGFGAVLEDMLDANPNVVCYRKAKSASGLARPDFFDWPDQAKRQVEFRKPDLVIVIMGANDGQDLTPWKGDKRVHWDTEDWPAGYRDRVDDFVSGLRTEVEGGDPAKVLWLGLPKMPSPSLERKLTVIRGIHEDAIAALGDEGVYVDTTPYLVDDQGALMKSAKIKGKDRELRSEDGVHFTMSGCEYLADKIYPEVLSALGLPAEPSK